MKQNIIHAAFFTPMRAGNWGLPLLLWGKPGLAKTAIIKQIGGMLGWHVEHLTPGERGEGAFGVTPVPVDKDGRTILSYPAPEWVENLRTPKGGEQGVVFFDELNTAPPALQPALLGGIQERRIGGHTFGDRVRVIGAANPIGHAAGGWDLAAPVANRLGHIDWEAPDADEWGAWLLAGEEEVGTLDSVMEEARVMEAWPNAYAKASGLVTAFVRRRPELLHKMPKDGDSAQSRAWPSPRTWEYAARARASAEVHHLNEIDNDEFVAAFIGRAAAGEWATWIENADLPEPSDVLDNKVKWEHNPKRLDRTEAVLSACASLVIPKQAAKRKERVDALWHILDKVSDDAKDIVIPSMQGLVRANLQRSKTARPVLAKLHSVVQAAGMTGGGRR